MRSLPGFAPTSLRYGRAGGGGGMGSPGSAPEAKSMHAARSRTVRDWNPWTLTGVSHSVDGHMLMRPRVPFKPTSPQAAAGKRMEPPPSEPCDTGTIKAATAAQEPPLDPAGVRVRSQGFLDGPHANGSVVATAPNS